MKKTRVASRYAKSLLDLSMERGELGNAYADMKLVSEICSGCKDLTLLLKSPIIKADKKSSIMEKIFSNRISKLSLLFIDKVIKKRRENYLEAIALEFLKQYKKNKNILTAVVTSATGLDDNIRNELMKIIEKETNSEVEIVEKKDKEIIGGFILRIDDIQFDASIQRKLNELSKIFGQNPYIRDFKLN